MPDPRVQDKSLVARCLAGDPESWGFFVRRYTPVLRHAVRKCLIRLGDSSRAGREEDLLQEILAFVSRPDGPLAAFRWGCSLPTYLTAVATQRCLLHLRSERNSREYPLAPLVQELLSSEAPPPAALEQAETRLKVQQALRQLTEREQLVLQMVYWDALPAEKVAPLLGISRDAVWQVLSRARDRLRDLLRSGLFCLFF